MTTKTTLSVSVTPELKYFVDGTEVTKEMLESSVNSALVKLAAQDPVISLNIDKTVAVEHLVFVMQTCNKLNAKVVLATQPE